MSEDSRHDSAQQELKALLRRDILSLVIAGGAPAVGASASQDDATSLRAWSEYVDMLKPAGGLIDLTLDPTSQQIRAELYRQLVMNIAQSYVWYFQATPAHPDWMPFENSIFLLQPNPDAIYHLAPVEGSGVYRIIGNRGGNKVMGFAVGRGMFGTAEPQVGFNNYDADGLTLSPNGNFEVIFSAVKPAGWTGERPAVHRSLVRLLRAGLVVL